MPTEKNAVFLPRQWGFKLKRQRVKPFEKILPNKDSINAYPANVENILKS
jgi:hypothetical protein